jgi:head-tail adaptor
MKSGAGGERDRRIVFERGAAARNALGGKAPLAWTALGSRFAKVLYGTGSERRAAGIEGAVQSATFRVLCDDLTRTVLVTDRIAFDGSHWDITSVAPIGRGPMFIDFTGVASRS